MSDFEKFAEKDGFAMKLWRGERMCLIGFNVEDPEPDLVGFSIECKAPGSQKFVPLPNRLAFSYDEPDSAAVTGARKFPSTEAPFQKFRWVHFPYIPEAGLYTYKGTKVHMRDDGGLYRGTSITLKISLDPVTYAGFLDVGFSRGFASSQAFLDKFPKATDINAVGRKIIPSTSDEGLEFEKMDGDIYSWLGFEAQELIFSFLDEAVKDKEIEIDFFAYDLNEPDIVARLEALGTRLRAIIDNSTTIKKGVETGHGINTSPESKAERRLRDTAGAANVKRTRFKNLQHHKVFIAKRNGVPFKVLAGSTNFSFRGLYIQSNNVLVFDEPEIAGLYEEVFEASFKAPDKFSSNAIAKKWHTVQPQGKPAIHFCFSPHTSPDIALNPVRGAIEQASSSVLYCVAFLSLIKSGPTKEAFDRLLERSVFSYGVSDKAGGLAVIKPDGSTGLVDFSYLAKNSPEPFKSEWSGGKGINVHHKFVITDFNLPTAKVFTGSSNLSPSGENKNGDHLIMIEDQKVAIAYTIEALRVFDHLHFRSKMKKAFDGKKGRLTLRKPTAISGKPAWFEEFYIPGSQKANDRILFSK